MSGWRQRLPLRTQLVALVLLLAALAVAMTGLAGARILRDQLIARTDGDLAAIAEQAGRLRMGEGTPFTRGPRSEPDIGDAGSAAILLYVAADGTLTDLGRPLTDRFSPPRLRLQDVMTTGSVSQDPFTVRSVKGPGSWRVQVTPLSNGTFVAALPLDDVFDTVARLIRIDLAVGAVALALLAVLAWMTVRTSLRPLAEVERTAEGIAAGDLSHRVPPSDPRTEVGSLSASINSMLARIEAAFEAQRTSEAAARSSEERMRRFVGDASHELRTPLTSVRGFAELYRQGAVDPASMPQVMSRIEAEAARMGLLVEDLLLLARLDQQRPLQRLPVDLVALAADAAQDAPANSPDHPFTLRVLGSDTPPVVLGDEARLRQVVANLMSNAVTHTPAGTPIRLSVGTIPGQPTAMLQVSDEGPGMAPEVAERAFERFFRADDSRTRAPAVDGTVGSGLGLSIVTALVAAHGGRVELRTSQGHGASFTVLLPLAGVLAEEGSGAQAGSVAGSQAGPQPFTASPQVGG